MKNEIDDFQKLLQEVCDCMNSIGALMMKYPHHRKVILHLLFLLHLDFLKPEFRSEMISEMKLMQIAYGDKITNSSTDIVAWLIDFLDTMEEED